MLFSAILSLPIFIFMDVLFTIPMQGLIILSVVFSIISLVILATQQEKIRKMENNEDDKGMMHKLNGADKNESNKYQKSKVKSEYKNKGYFKPILGIIVTVLVLILNPASDMYYYVAALFSIVMSIFSFSNIIKKYNLLTTRKLPQLGKRGGDENA